MVQTLANRSGIGYNVVALVTCTRITSWVVVAGPMITTDIVEAFINIYREQLTTGSYQSVITFHNLHKYDLITSKRDRDIFLFVPLHGLDPAGGDAGSVALNPSKQVQMYEPMVLLQLE